MPELPEVETVVRTLRPRLVGRAIAAVRLERPDILDPAGIDLSARLIGRAVKSIDRHGKRIVVTLDDANRFYVHLGMTGQLTIEPPAQPLKPHTHLVIDVTDPDRAPSQLRFRDPRRFGGIWWLGNAANGDQHLGPEPLVIRPAQLAARLARTKRAIKAALLDQSLIAGLGNIYVDEALFEASIHPLIPAHKLKRDQVARLTRALKFILRRAIRHRGSTLRDYRDATGEPGGFQTRHRVYHRAGQPCARCETPVRRIIVGGRSTHFCPKCQHRRKP